MESCISLGDQVFQVTQDHEAVISRVRCDRGAGSKEVRAVGKLVVEVGGGVSDNTNGEVEAGDGLGCNIVRSRRERASGGYRIGGAELATVKEEKETVVAVSSAQGRAPRPLCYELLRVWFS